MFHELGMRYFGLTYVYDVNIVLVLKKVNEIQLRRNGKLVTKAEF